MDSRELAFEALEKWRREDCYVREALAELSADVSVTPSDEALAAQIAMGVVRHKLTLHYIAGHFVAAKWNRLRPAVRQLLAMGVYQLLWLDRVPDYAAIGQTVEQARRHANDRTARLVNAVLRSVQRSVEQIRIPLPEIDRADTLPVKNAEAVLFSGDIFPDPKQGKGVDFLSVTSSHPAFLVSRWLRQFGRDDTRHICRQGSMIPPLMVRPNRLRTDAAGLQQALHAEGVSSQPSADGSFLRIDKHARLVELAAFRAGLFQPQDPTSAWIVDQTRAGPDDKVLDMCAAPGTKTVLLGERMQNRGCIIATDRSPERLKLLMPNCTRLGIEIVRTCSVDEVDKRLGEIGGVDLILLDAPCSNTGVLSRRPEARYRVNLLSLLSLQTEQIRLLRGAASLAGTDTRIVYATCSIEPEEGELVVQQFVADHPEWRVDDQQRRLPRAGNSQSEWRDGGFFARLVRK